MMGKIINYYFFDDYLPYSFCQTNQNNQSFSGFEFELLDSGLSLLKKTENITYQYLCLKSNEYKTMSDCFKTLLTNQTNYGILGGVTISSGRIQDNYMFSMPTIQDNLVAMSYVPTKGEFVLNSFVDANVSVSFFMTLILLGFLFFLYERTINHEYFQNNFSSLIQGFWDGYLIIFRIPFKIFSFESKCLQLFFILTSFYMVLSMMSSIIINFKKDDFTQLKTPSQLDSKKAFTYSIYSDIVLSYNIQLYHGLNELADTSTLLSALTNNEYDYFISDASVLSSIAQTQCQFKISTVDILQFNMGVIMANSPENIEFLRITNKAIALAQSNTDFVKNLTKKYFDGNNDCNSFRKNFFDNGENISDPIDYNTFLGTFIALIIILVIAIIAKLFERKMRVFFKNTKETNQVIKKLSNLEAQILKKITIFIELLTNKWNTLIKNFEEDQTIVMESEKNSNFLIHDIYNKISLLFNNNQNSSNFIELKTPNIIKSPSFSPKKSKFLLQSLIPKKRPSNLTIFEDIDIRSEEIDEKAETNKLKLD